MWLSASDGLAAVDPATSAIVPTLPPGDIRGTNAAAIAVVWTSGAEEPVSWP